MTTTSLQLLVFRRLSEILPPQWHQNAVFTQLAFLALEASLAGKLWIIRVRREGGNADFFFESR